MHLKIVRQVAKLQQSPIFGKKMGNCWPSCINHSYFYSSVTITKQLWILQCFSSHHRTINRRYKMKGLKFDNVDFLQHIICTEYIKIWILKQSSFSSPCDPVLTDKSCFAFYMKLQVATFILQKILLDETGLSYICQTYERFSHVAMILVSFKIQQQNILTNCYMRTDQICKFPREVVPNMG